jgi:hypothetical protein
MSPALTNLLTGDGTPRTQQLPDGAALRQSPPAAAHRCSRNTQPNTGEYDMSHLNSETMERQL